ncbi:hypothetical protein C7B64_19395 [Merismopedia glauca CCAP 1448/3]|uniref:Uncharacterized protein n=1 Tax=Merismopedia glauca CCAP 1448/3 TaxID=1296344 RepID=A0A2T1BYY0_9CYAN|nr:hypothetical protein C7B64_19395 [Merismopedia glauca CCAP 1448/3]
MGGQGGWGEQGGERGDLITRFGLKEHFLENIHLKAAPLPPPPLLFLNDLPKLLKELYNK